MKKNNKTDKNYGIAILRVLLALMVVIDHFYNIHLKKGFIHILYYHIPTFFLISFYFTYNTFSTYNISKIKSRFERLIIPYIGWNLISWILQNIYFYIFKKQCHHKLSDLFHTLLNGHILVLALWFQNILILTTIVFTIIVFSFKNEYLLILQILFIISYGLQYSGYNYYFFKSHFSVFYYNTYGRFFSTVPNSISGFYIAQHKILDKLKKYKIRTLILSFIILVIISKYKFDNSIIMFKYGGLRLNTASICIFLLFFYLPFKKDMNRRIKKILDIITNYTAGIYFSHTLIGKGYLMNFLLGKKIETLFGCIIIYLTSFILCFLFDKVFNNRKLKHLIK